MVRFIAGLFILQLLLIPPGNSNAAPLISIGDYDVLVGETATIDIMVSDIDAIINSFSFRVAFDPIGLTAGSVVAGGSVPSSTSFFFQGEADNDGGLISLFYAPFVPSPPQIDTAGILASFDVTGDVLGSYQLSIIDLAFSDVLDPVTVDFRNGNVNVNAVPIPPALLLFGSGLIGLVGLRRKIKI